jgi:hypothetical protein
MVHPTEEMGKARDHPANQCTKVRLCNPLSVENLLYTLGAVWFRGYLRWLEAATEKMATKRLV